MTEKAKMLLDDFIDELAKSNNEELIASIKKLAKWAPERMPDEFSEDNDFYVEGDEDAPFFSEIYLYILLGKSDARTLLAYMKPIWKLANLK